jgi:predicted MPP superfamily phosphohydrolase
MSTTIVIAACATITLAAYGWFEAGWLRTRVREVPVPGLPDALDGVRIGHLSDFHLGARLSRGNRATRRAVAWVAKRRPEVVCVTGDLVSHPRGEARLRSFLGELGQPLVVLGNHDVAVTRDPFSRAAELRDLERTVLLRDDAKTIEVRGERIRFVGVDPESYRARTARPQELIEPDVALRVLLCHFPDIVHRLQPASFDLILAGHLHAGQISIPVRGRRVGLAHPRARFVTGIYETPAGTMHISPGTGTTFVPFRLFARPEVTELVLRRQRVSKNATRR